MKKHILILGMAALLVLCACQPTPEQPIVMQKDQELMIEKGSATLPPEQPYTPPEVPERYAFDFQGGALTVHADAEVVVPSVPMPIVNVRAQGIPQETMYRLYELLSNGEELFLPHRRTKSEIEEEIKSCNELLNQQPPEGSDLSQEEYEYGLNLELEMLEQEYRTAPDTDEERVSDGTYETRYSTSDPKEYCILEAMNNQRNIFAFAYPNADQGSEFRYDRRLKGFDGYTEMHVIPLDESVTLPEDLSYEEAAACVRTFLDAVGEPFEIAAVYRIDDAMDGSTDGIVKDGERFALRFDCRRVVNNVPLALNASNAGYSENSSYSIPWCQEFIRVVVDADGIVSIRWKDPLTLSETVSDASKLMPFETVRGIAEKMLPIIYLVTESDGTESRSIDIHSVRLELIRVREQNNVNELKGMLIPAWVFYGTVKIMKTYPSGDTYTFYTQYGIRSGSDYYEGEEIVLCINAIDGSIIDPMLGY